MKEGYQDTEHDLEQLSAIIEGKLTKEDFEDVIKIFPDSKENKLELNRIRILFDEDGRVEKVIFAW